MSLPHTGLLVRGVQGSGCRGTAYAYGLAGVWRPALGAAVLAGVVKLFRRRASFVRVWLIAFAIAMAVLCLLVLNAALSRP